mmetsp:Transcript_70276/g.141562  ORF Transcript_70276/g.141562 Transcript_70276/m.141562 type:complete len:254 (+) Transcript_70276:316-1077(+)
MPHVPLANFTLIRPASVTPNTSPNSPAAMSLFDETQHRLLPMGWPAFSAAACSAAFFSAATFKSHFSLVSRSSLSMPHVPLANFTLIRPASVTPNTSPNSPAAMSLFDETQHRLLPMGWPAFSAAACSAAFFAASAWSRAFLSASSRTFRASSSSASLSACSFSNLPAAAFFASAPSCLPPPLAASTINAFNAVFLSWGASSSKACWYFSFRPLRSLTLVTPSLFQRYPRTTLVLSSERSARLTKATSSQGKN